MLGVQFTRTHDPYQRIGDAILTLIEKLQAYLREAARGRYGAIALPPFTAFLDPDIDKLYANYAIPDRAVTQEDALALAALEAAFTDKGRTPRFEYIEGFAPELAVLLEGAGFKLEGRAILMTCEALQPAREVPGLLIERVGPGASDEAGEAIRSIQHWAFEGMAPGAWTLEEKTAWCRLLETVTFFLATIEGRPVGTGCLTGAIAGVAEVAGIATLPDWRRRGIAGAVAHAATRYGFEQGIELAMLTAGSEEAGRLYAHLGYQVEGASLAFAKP